MSTWLESLRVYRQKRLLVVLFMGFASGLPFPLTFATLSLWLAEQGVSRTSIGLFVLVGFSYNWKFLWSPAIDRLPLPWLTATLGRRRGWLVLIQSLLVLAILALGQTSPAENLALTAFLCVVVAFLSASQDIVVDAYRIEILAPDEQGAGAAATQWGYRFGLLAAGAGALYAADFGGWRFAYDLMAALMLIGLATVLIAREPAASTHALDPLPGQTPAARVRAWVEAAVIAPFGDFLQLPGWLAVLVFIVLYKLGDSLAGVMANPFYVEMGFSKIEIANISKLFGFFATLAGVAAGGLVTQRLGFYRSLLVCGVLQLLSNFMYAIQAVVGHDPVMLALTIGAENFTGGMGSAAFVAYLSGLTNVAFTATQYALLSSLAAVPAKFLASPSGWLASQLDWVAYFIFTAGAALPGLLMIAFLMRRFPLAPETRLRPALAVDD